LVSGNQALQLGSGTRLSRLVSEFLALEMLALHKLQHDLVSFSLFKSLIGDVVQLIRYTYENTAQLADSPCPLRDLVTVYAICKVKVLWKSKEFQGLFVSCGELAGELFSQAMKRID
jgi:hypothetical protein